MPAPSLSTDERAATFRPPAYFQDDPVVQDYADYFATLDFSGVPPRCASGLGRQGHPGTAYIKGLLVMIREKLPYVTGLRNFLVKHPPLVLLLGFRPVPSEASPYGFDVSRTVPTDRHWRRKLQTIPNAFLQSILQGTVTDLKEEVPHLGRRVALDNKHLYAFVKQNNRKAYVKDRYHPMCQPTGDPDCRLGVKRRTNQTPNPASQTSVEASDSPADSPTQTASQAVAKEYVWGYGTSVVATKHRRWGEFVLAEQTLPFNRADIDFFPTLLPIVERRLGFRPKRFTADAAYDAWYVYDYFAQVGGRAYIPLNLRGHPLPRLGKNGFHVCDDKREMIGTGIYFDHTRGFTAQTERCPLLFGTSPENETCRIQHPQFRKGGGCVKQLNKELGARVRIELDRSSPEYKREYAWRTTDERIFSQAKELGIERPRQRNIASIRNRNTLIYIVINTNALKRARMAKQQENRRL